MSDILNRDYIFLVNWAQIAPCLMFGYCWSSVFTCSLFPTLIGIGCVLQLSLNFSPATANANAKRYVRCWNTLGFAIRMGQSIGLHVELSLNSSHAEPSWMRDRAHWRRTWYSMYVLDRLLALQLGRPMAIHEADFQVELPSVTDEAPFGHISDEAPAESRRPPCRYMMDYFFEVIRFSQILGSVIRELYRPTQIDLSPDQMLQSTSDLDQRLLEWKTNLPRHLRFDLGHTFEKSISFKRQVSLFVRPCIPLRYLNVY